MDHTALQTERYLTTSVVFAEQSNAVSETNQSTVTWYKSTPHTHAGQMSLSSTQRFIATWLSAMLILMGAAFAFSVSALIGQNFTLLSYAAPTFVGAIGMALTIKKASRDIAE